VAKTAYHDHVHQANQNKSEGDRYCTKEDDGLTEGAYCSCTAGYEIYACFSKILYHVYVVVVVVRLGL
jgi:hypothetical protein